MRRYYSVLIFIFVVVWVWAAIDPVSRRTWLMENLPVLVAVPLLLRYGRYFGLSRLSWTMLTLFVMLHLVGSHYTYPKAPPGEWLRAVLGEERNQYDRIVPFAFGLLLYYPIHDVFQNFVKARGVWKHVAPLTVILALAALFEILEWLVVMGFAPSGSGAAYIGAQGDQWDAQKDMMLAGVGAALVMISVLTTRRQRKTRERRKERRLARRRAREPKSQRAKELKS